MYCPHCGSQYESNPRFCKSCGNNLAAISSLLSGEAKDPEMALIEEKYFKRIMRGGFSALVIVLAIIWIIALGVGKIERGEFIPFVVILTWIASIVVFLTWFINRQAKRIELLRLEKQNPGTKTEAVHKQSIDIPPEPAQLTPPSSVVEGTTELLENGADKDEKIKEPIRRQ